MLRGIPCCRCVPTWGAAALPCPLKLPTLAGMPFSLHGKSFVRLASATDSHAGSGGESKARSQDYATYTNKRVAARLTHSNHAQEYLQAPLLQPLAHKAVQAKSLAAAWTEHSPGLAQLPRAPLLLPSL